VLVDLQGEGGQLRAEGLGYGRGDLRSPAGPLERVERREPAVTEGQRHPEQEAEVVGQARDQRVPVMEWKCTGLPWTPSSRVSSSTAFRPEATAA